MASIVLDDLSERLKYGGGSWSSVGGSRFFGGSSTWPGFAANDKGDTGDFGTIDFAFQGTSVAFFGNTPPAINSQSILVSIDGAAPYSSSYEDPAPQSTRQWYQSPTLADKNHSISISHLSTTSVDFVVINAGKDTPLSGETLIVDDADPSIVYNGDWTVDRDLFHANDFPLIGFPFGNSTHQTSTPGASATFKFTGTSVSLYGIWAWNVIGNLAIKYTLDGTSFIKTHTVTTSVPEFVDGAQQQPQFFFFSNDTLPPGNHTLDLELILCSGQTLILDYFLYRPSFDTLASKPDLNPTTTLPSGTSASIGSATPSGSSSNTSNGSKSSPVGAIVGGVVGGVSFLALIALLLFFCRRRLSKPKTVKGMEGITESTVTGSTPYLDPLPLEFSDTPRPLAFEPFIVPVNSPNASQSVPDSSVNSDIDVTPYGIRRRSDPPSDGAGRSQMSQHKSMLSSSSAGVLLPTTPSPSQEATYHIEDVVGRSIISPGGDAFRSRMQRLQDLVQELNREIENGGDAEGVNSLRVSELRGRIAELTREDMDNAIGGLASGGRRARVTVSQSGTIPPPAYDYDPMAG